MSSEGASLSEQLLDASRRNNVDLLESILEASENDAAKIADLINTSNDPFGNTALHLCCKYGSWETLDKILDQEGDIEIDPKNTDGNTPLHITVQYADSEPEHGTFIASNLIEVGSDPRIQNNENKKPLDLIHSNELDELIDLLQGAEIAADSGVGHGHEEEEEVVEDEDDEEE